MRGQILGRRKGRDVVGGLLTGEGACLAHEQRRYAEAEPGEQTNLFLNRPTRRGPGVLNPPVKKQAHPPAVFARELADADQGQLYQRAL